MQRLSSLRSLAEPLLKSRRGFSTSSDKIVASVLFERLRVVIPKPDPAVYTFEEFKFNWQQQFRRRYPDEFLDIAKNRAKGEYQMDYVPAPRVTEADKKNDRKSLYRALDKKLYLLIFGKPFGSTSDKSIWHFPEKVYDSEPTLRKCAESALKSVLGDLTHTYFVGNAPMAHMAIQPTEETPDLPPYKVFYSREDDSSNWYVVMRAPPRGYHELETEEDVGFAPPLPVQEVQDLDGEQSDDESVYVRDDCEGLLVVDS